MKAKIKAERNVTKTGWILTVNYDNTVEYPTEKRVYKTRNEAYQAMRRIYSSPCWKLNYRYKTIEVCRPVLNLNESVWDNYIGGEYPETVEDIVSLADALDAPIFVDYETREVVLEHNDTHKICDF